MLKKLFIILLSIIIVLFFAAPSFLGFSLLNLGHAVSMSTSMSAKLACSAKFISGFDEQQIVNDIASYSPATKLVKLEYSNHPKQVTGSLYGMKTITAKYREGLGCSLEVGDTAQLDKINISEDLVTKSPSKQQTWPNGKLVNTIVPSIQKMLNNIVREDNSKGLNTRAMLVIKNGEIVAENYAESITKDTPLLGWSMGKSVTAMMIGRMEQLEMANMEQENLFEQWQNDGRSKLTLAHLLQMRSGLEFDETYAPGSDSTHMLFTARSASDVALKSPLTKPPGTHFSYSSGTTNILSRYIHDRLGNSTQANVDFLYQQLFKPLNMKNTFFEVDSSGVFVGSSYLYASGRDWGRLGLLMLNNGIWNENQLLPQKWVKQASMPNSSDNDSRYGYQFWLNAGKKDSTTTLRWPSLPEDAYAMMGNRKQSVMIIPSENIVFVRIGWTKGEYPMEENYRKLLNPKVG